ncbi:MAG: hypothetical protein ACOC4M_13130, partial [Promethearchaeia archaeon]
MSKESQNTYLVFIYNADSGALNSIKDFFHKMVKPSTYECNLCAVTFGNFGMKKDWVKYVNKIENEFERVSIEFLHRDEFEKYYPAVKDAQYPSAYFHNSQKTELFITQDEMNSVKSIEELKGMVSERLNA